MTKSRLLRVLMALLVAQAVFAVPPPVNDNARPALKNFDSPPAPTKVTYMMAKVVDSDDPNEAMGQKLLRDTKAELSPLFHYEGGRVLLYFDPSKCEVGPTCDLVSITKEKDQYGERYRVEIDCKSVRLAQESIDAQRWPRIVSKIARVISQHDAEHIVKNAKKN